MSSPQAPVRRTALHGLITSGLAPLISGTPIPLRMLRPLLLRDNRREVVDGWERLRSPDEAGRYWLVRGVLHERCRAGSVLDLGCGSGLLRDGLDCSQYTGVDDVRSAFGGADLTAGPHERFVVADAQTYEPDRRYDAVVFNESLYYLADPLAAVERACGFLTPGGVVVISCYSRAWALRRLLRTTATVAPVVAEFTVGSSTGKRWTVQTLRPTVGDSGAGSPGRRGRRGPMVRRRIAGGF